MSKFKLLTFEEYMDRLITSRITVRADDDILVAKLLIFRRILLQFGFGTVIHISNEVMTDILGYVDDNYVSLEALNTDEELISVFLFDNVDFAPCECCRDITYIKTNILCLDCTSDVQQTKFLYNVITSHWDNQ